MLTFEEIRADLKDIRYFFTHKEAFDEAEKKVGRNEVEGIVIKYNEVMRRAPPRMYDLYVGLYVKGFTQEGLASAMGYSEAYIQMLNKRLLVYLQQQIKEDRNGY